MLEPATLALFASATFVIAITPAPDQIYIANRGASQGSKAGLVSALGIHTGIFIHILAAALGLAALIAASPLAFNIMQYLGASYLIYLGIRTLLAKKAFANASDTLQSVSLRQIYLEGVIINLLNPRALLFFFAFLPQFVSQENGLVALQIILLGCLAIVISLPIDAGIGWLAGSLRGFTQQGFHRYGTWVTSGIFILLGVSAFAQGFF